MIHLLIPKFAERWFWRASRWMFLRLFPMYCAEVGCSVSVLALFMLWQGNGFVEISAAIRNSVNSQEFPHAVFACAMLVAGAVGLCVPFTALFKEVSNGFHKVAALVAVLTMICAEGAAAGECFFTLHRSVSIAGVPLNLILGIVGFVEMAGLCMGMVFLLGLTIDGARKASPLLAARNMAVTCVVVASQVLFHWCTVSIAVLASAHVLFLLSIRHAPKSNWKEEIDTQFE